MPIAMPPKRINANNNLIASKCEGMVFRRLMPQKSEEQYVEKIRKTVRFWDAWKSWVLAGSVIMLIVLTAFLNWLFSLFTTPDPSGLIPDENYSRTWMLFAFIFGIQFGMWVYEWIDYLVKACLGGYRAERLLLAMHDAEDDNQQGKADD